MNGAEADAQDGFGPTAYVVGREARCLFEPHDCSAVRVIPPYGSTVEIVRDEEAWVLIRFCGKEAWSPRENLSDRLIPERASRDVGSVPTGNYDFRSTSRPESYSSPVEYGPRGGRFVRTSTGFRRYF